jgi:hypothetical protein
LEVLNYLKKDDASLNFVSKIDHQKEIQGLKDLIKIQSDIIDIDVKNDFTTQLETLKNYYLALNRTLEKHM